MAILLGLATLALPASAAEPTKFEMETLVNDLDAAAAQWAQGKTPDNQSLLTSKLKAVTYGPASLELLQAAINKPRRDPASLYVANALLGPLLMARNETIATALPVIQRFRSQAGSFREMPTLAPQELAKYQGPASLPAEGLTPAEQSVRDLRQRKLDRERPIALHNQQLYALDETIAKLMLYAGTADFDGQLLKMLRETQQKNLWTYVDILAAIREEAGKMDAARAKMFYQALLELATELRSRKAQYLQPGRTTLEAAGQSVVPSQLDYPAIRLIEAVNVLASSAHLPAINVPTSQEVDSGKPATAPATPPNTAPPRSPGAARDSSSQRADH